GVPVTRPVITETTALGAAYAAGLTVGFWESTDEIRAMWREDVTFTPDMDADRRDDLFANWGKAVTRTLDWVDD
ncbi:MAG: glycerol kinase, partial [Corynebacterium sp.]|nr:glycerol kinase [Corynebacterium sp.]